VARELTNTENQVWLSPISFWEVQFLYRERRIELEGMDVEMKLAHGDPGDYFLGRHCKGIWVDLGNLRRAHHPFCRRSHLSQAVIVDFD
jgi:hypothetical protein